MKSFNVLKHKGNAGRWLMLAGIVILIFFTLACTVTPPVAPPAAEPGQAPEQAAGEPESQAAPGEPQPGGVYRIAGAGDLRSLDPPAAEDWEDWWSAGKLLYNTLYAYDAQGQALPELAADMPQMSEDGLVYTIPLRQGVKFHNGRDMVAEDVKFSLERQLWPEVYSWGKSYMDNVEGYQEVIDGQAKELSGITVVDDHTLEIRLKQPQAVFPSLLSMSMNAIVPKQEVLDAGEDWGSKVVIGTGPFRFVEWVPGEKAVYERNPDYFKAGLPYLDRVELYLNVDPAVQMLRWESGELEFVHVIPDAELPRLLTDPTLSAQLRSAPRISTLRMGFYLNAPPFDNIKVRQAVAMAIDKQGMVKKMSGTVTPVEGHYAIPMLQFSKDFKSNYQYNPEQAKQLLAEAGYPDGIKDVKLYISVSTTQPAELAQADLQAIGIDAELVLGQWKEHRDRIRAGDIQLFIYGWGASFPDAFDFTSAWTTCKSGELGYNDGWYCNAQVDELFEKAEALPLQDPERIAAYREIEDIVINQDVAWIGLYNEQQIGLGVDYVKGDVMDSIYGWPSLESAWLESGE